MAKTAHQQEQLNHIWHHLHEKQGRSAKAAEQARRLRQQYSDNDEMLGELAAMEMVTASAAAQRSRNFSQAYPHFIQSAEVVHQAFPLGKTEEEANTKGNALDVVYGEASAQLEMLRSYFHLIDRLNRVLANKDFGHYTSQLWQFLNIKLSEYSQNNALLLLTIEYGNYHDAQEAYVDFSKKISSAEITDISRIITTSARMLNRALVESDYETAVVAFQAAIRALANDRTKLAHFGKQIASNVRADRTIALKKKLESWSQETKGFDLNQLLALQELIFVGLGKNQTDMIK